MPAFDPLVPPASERDQLLELKRITTLATGAAQKPSVLTTCTTVAQVITVLAAMGVVIDGNA